MLCSDTLCCISRGISRPIYPQTPAMGFRQGRGTSVLSFRLPQDKEFSICLFLFPDLHGSSASTIPPLCNCVMLGLAGAGEPPQPPLQAGDRFGINSAFLSALTLSEQVRSLPGRSFSLLGGEICILLSSFSFLFYFQFFAILSQDLIQSLSVR